MSANTVPITSNRSTTGDLRAGPSTSSGVPLDIGPLGEHAEPRGAEEKTEGVSPGAEVPSLTQANLKRLEDKDPVAAALPSVLSSLPPSETMPIPGFAVANAKVTAWRRAAGKGKGKDADLGPMFGATWGHNTFQGPYGESDASVSAHWSEWECYWISREPTPWKEPKEPEYLERVSSPRRVSPKPSCLEQGLPQHMAALKLGVNETMELLSRVLAAGDEDPDVSALSAAQLGLSDLKKPPPTMSPGVEGLTRDVKSCRGIRSLPMDTSSSPFHSCVTVLPVCSVGDTTEAEMKSCGLAALAPLATTHPSLP